MTTEKASSDSTKCGGMEALPPSLLLHQGTDLSCSTPLVNRGGTVQQPKPTVAKRRHVASKRKNDVQFSLMSKLYIFEYTPPSKTWYTDADYQRFKRELKTDILSIREQLHATSVDHDTANTTFVGPYSCPVGIEQASSVQDVIQAERLKSISIRLVLEEQYRQQVLGYNDPKRIAFLYGRLTAEARERAHKRGKFHNLVKFV